MKSRTTTARCEPIGRGSAAITRRASIARSEENWPAGAAVDTGRGASTGVTAAATATNTRPTMSPANRYRRASTSSL